MASAPFTSCPPLASTLHRAGGLFILLFLMAGSSGQDGVQASFLVLGGSCLALAEWMTHRRQQAWTK